jgi:hypothetical protein
VEADTFASRGEDSLDRYGYCHLERADELTAALVAQAVMSRGLPFRAAARSTTKPPRLPAALATARWSRLFALDGPGGTRFTMTPEAVLDSLVLGRPEPGADARESDRLILDFLEQQADPLTGEKINSHLGDNPSRSAIFRRLPELVAAGGRRRKQEGKKQGLLDRLSLGRV